MDRIFSTSSTMRAGLLDGPHPESLESDEPCRDTASTWIDRYLAACGIGDVSRRRDMRRRISAEMTEDSRPRGLDSEGVADLQRRIDRLLLAGAGKTGPTPDGVCEIGREIGRMLADEADRPAAVRVVAGIAMPRMAPAPMPAQVVHDDHSLWNDIFASPSGGVRRLSAGLTGVVALIFGGR